MRIGSVITEWRKKRGLKQKELAAKTGISVSSLSLIEKGNRENFYLHISLAISWIGHQKLKFCPKLEFRSLIFIYNITKKHRVRILIWMRRQLTTLSIVSLDYSEINHPDWCGICIWFIVNGAWHLYFCRCVGAQYELQAASGNDIISKSET